MKTTKIAQLIALFGVTLIISFLVAYQLFGAKKVGTISVDVPDVVQAEFPEVPKQYINPQALNPTKTITVEGPSNNQQPFSGAQ